jgi:hypothetical protein
MAKLEKKSLNQADEVRKVPQGLVEVVKLGDLVVGKTTFQPGWRWSECVKPIAGTASCQAHHNGIIISGRLHIRMDDGSEAEAGPGDVFVCPPGHDAWVIGEEPCVGYDFAGMANYAKPA